MTTITLLSDLHLECEKPPECFHPGEGDVLVLAGDICTAKYINKEESPYGKIFRNFFAECSKNYNKVFYVMGNHEHYGGNLTYTAERLRECTDNFANIHLLDREVEIYDGWNFVGATLWTDFAGNNPNAMLLAEQGMNDYKTIRIGGSYQKLFAKDILHEFYKTLHWIEDTLETLDGPTFVITHHQPSFQSINHRYGGNAYNPLFASELSGLISRYPQIKYWAAGHTHSSVDYVTDQCRVIGNPRGYPPSFGGNNHDFNPNFTIKL